MQCQSPDCIQSQMNTAFEQPGGTAEFRAMKQQSVAASLRSTAELTLVTKEGDRVTLSSNAYADYESFSYDRTGTVVNQNNEQTSSFSYRTMTLSMGTSFSFSVKGDLSDEEMDDIESIMKSIDEIMVEMAEGDMDTALEKALQMDGYDTVSQFNADLSMSQSYRVYTEMAAESRVDLPGNDFGETGLRHSKPEVESLVEKMLKALEEQDKVPFATMKTPVDQLFEHYLNQMQSKGRSHSSLFKDLADARAMMQEKIREMLEQASSAGFEV